MKTLTKLAGFLLALALVPAAPATVITYVGRQTDYGPGWRTSAVSKPLDLNGDNILGTDGYQVVNRPAVLPTYVSSMAILTTTYAGNANYASMDDPTNAPATFVTGTMNAAPRPNTPTNLFRFTLNGKAVGRTIRVGLLVDNLDNASSNALSLTLALTNGTVATSPEVLTGPCCSFFNDRKPDWVFFDITGAANGDAFIIQGKRQSAGFATLGGVAFDSATVAWSFNGATDPALAALDAAMTNYMAIRTISRGALAVTKDGKLVFHRAYTYAPAGTAPTQTTNLFRIASLTKQLTAVGILQLAQAGKLNLTNTIGQLLNLTNFVDPFFTNVTVQQLLQHTGGWNRDVGYDPMLYDRQITTALGLPLPTTPQMIIDFMEREPLDFVPGTEYHYSNFGYSLLGRIIEAVTGQKYEDFIRANVLRPAGIWDMQLGRPLLTNALPAEVDYDDPTSAIVNSVMGSNSPPQVPDPYGGFNLDAMDSHGRWVANAADLVRFSSSFDVITNSPLLSSNWIYQMWSAPSFQPTATVYYGDGWSVRPLGGGAYNAWHDGALPGTYSYTVRLANGICWATVFNRRYSDVFSTPLFSDGNIDPEISAAINSVTTWPAVDLFNRVVTTVADTGPGSLREAVSSLAAGTTITFAPGLSGQTITLTSGQITLSNNLTIDASSLPGSITVSGNHSSRVFQVAPGATAGLANLTIQNGAAGAGSGGGIWNQGTLGLTNVTLTGSLANQGGGIENDGTLTLNACTLAGNSSTNYGGGIANGGPLTVKDSTLSGNSSTASDGGGIANFAALALNNSTLSGNTAHAGGGIANYFAGAVTLNNCTLSGNSAGPADGGGINIYLGSAALTNCTLAGNSAVNLGGGINNAGGTLALVNTIVAGNSASSGANINGSFSGTPNLTSGNPLLAPLGNYGGPTPTRPPLPGSPAIDTGINSVTNSLATDQRGSPRLAIAHVDLGSVESQTPSLVVTTNSDSGPGSLRQLVSQADVSAAITFAPGLSGQTITLTNGSITLPNIVTIDASTLAGGITLNGNHATRIFRVNSIAVLNSLIIVNGNDTGGNAGGGGILSFGTLTLNNCTLSGNAANQAGWGGGGILSYNGTLTINQSTLSGNSANNSTSGGGIANYGGALTINQSTVSGNSAAGYGGGIWTGGTMTINNSIVSGNTQAFGSDINDINGAGAGTYTGVNLTSGNPLLASLGNYGGPTQTRPPLPGSPAINGCTGGTGFTTDQRGYPRIVGPFADIGAVESGNAVPGYSPIVTVNTDVVDGIGVGGVSLREAIAFAPNNTIITFANTLSGQTILLANGELLLEQNLTIDASGLSNGIAVSGNNSSRVFEIAAGAVVHLSALNIQNGYAPNGNSPTNYGGGILNRGTLALTNCTLTANQAQQGSKPVGGGIANYSVSATLTLQNCLVSSNHSDPYGGGGIDVNNGVASINQCTFTANSSTNGGHGGGINVEAGSVTINQCTVSSNSASTGGGVAENGTLTISNSIVAGNVATTGPNVAGSFTGAHNLTSGNPLLAPLGNYGGPTLTMPPLPGSPAIDGCTGGTSFTTDQRGYPRIVGTYADIGAVEGVYNPAMTLINPVHLGNGSFQFGFSNLSGPAYTVLASTNVAAPLKMWSNLGPALESPPGMFQFKDPQATNYPHRFYRLTVP